ncbi:hypothetical protein O1611_g10083 [Lasiodiplodia mahajangana]|uniref:Uncharacterized protein n=1 Tax=Lasiodiplodia mahajangana TaxID=1108764 RepID=A0ACC2J254_9PEZI|nr:hypothetical protein O1611_g10083 [Lasiodiplodia mahajangana]
MGQQQTKILGQERKSCVTPKDEMQAVPQKDERKANQAQHPPPPGSIRVRSEGMGTLVRNPISNSPLHRVYKRVGVIDGGNVNIGGMNNGIFVVQDKTTKRLYVEKVFRETTSTDEWLAKTEIMMMRRLMHNCIIHYIDAYIREDPFQASVYMEYCDRGTLADLIQEYKTKKKAHSPDRIPESFIWHAFLGLADALAYLQTGQSYISMPLEKNDRGDWKEVLHCDIKPSNIFLRSRDTPGSNKPFYTLLSDFGLMGFEGNTECGMFYRSYGTAEFRMIFPSPFSPAPTSLVGVVPD